MPRSDLVFLDTETTGLALDDDIWEFATIRVDPTRTIIDRMQYFVEHDPAKCAKLPEPFLTDHLKRWPGSHRPSAPVGFDVLSRGEAADSIKFAFMPTAAGKPHMVGACVDFDAYRMQLQWFAGGQVPWHYHLMDVENLAVGAAGVRAAVFSNSRDEYEAKRDKLLPPWDSEDLSEMFHVDPGQFARHTAMGDVEWAMAIWDAVMYA